MYYHPELSVADSCTFYESNWTLNIYYYTYCSTTQRTQHKTPAGCQLKNNFSAVTVTADKAEIQFKHIIYY